MLNKFFNGMINCINSFVIVIQCFDFVYDFTSPVNNVAPALAFANPVYQHHHRPPRRTRHNSCSSSSEEAGVGAGSELSPPTPRFPPGPRVPRTNPQCSISWRSNTPVGVSSRFNHNSSIGNLF